MLWDLLVVQAGLMSQLAAIKDYFLLARGDFYQSFLTDSRRLMALPPRAATVDTDIDGLFQAAGQKSSAATDRLFPLFRMRFTPLTPQVSMRTVRISRTYTYVCTYYCLRAIVYARTCVCYVRIHTLQRWA